jgi:DNA-binding response OmpR family regulator
MTETKDAETTIAETVLVVDEEVLVRMVIAAYLRDCGYRVIEAASAAEARLVIEHDEPATVSIVLSGAGMPDESNGFALAQWIRRRRPDLEVVLAGTPARAAEAAGDLCQRGPMLSRPYEPQVVLDRIRWLLSRRPRPQG